MKRRETKNRDVILEKGKESRKAIVLFFLDGFFNFFECDFFISFSAFFFSLALFLFHI